MQGWRSDGETRKGSLRDLVVSEARPAGVPTRASRAGWSIGRAGLNDETWNQPEKRGHHARALFLSHAVHGVCAQESQIANRPSGLRAGTLTMAAKALG